MAEGVHQVNASGDCAGTSPHKDLDVDFPAECGTVTDIPYKNGPTGVVEELHLFSVDFRPSKSDVQLFFTAGDTAPLAANSDVWVTTKERLPAKIEGSGSTFDIELNNTSVNLIKAHAPDQGAVVGPISIGKLVYTKID